MNRYGFVLVLVSRIRVYVISIRDTILGHIHFWAMGQAESNESAAVKRQAEGGAVPMYELLDLSGKIMYSSNV